MTTRRDVVFGMGATAGYGLFGGSAQALAKLNDQFKRIETESGGRLGVAVLDTQSQMRAGHHADDRFPMCSTFKLLAAAAVLKRVQTGNEKLDRRIKIEAADVVPGSSRISAPVPEGKTLAELCEVAMTFSDNTAGNLILASLGGPAGMTTFIRNLGDKITRLDRNEPTLNEAIPGDPRDTTTPNAMLKDLQTLLLGTALSETSKGLLMQWLIGNKTGDTRLRAGMPVGWKIGDKTGTGERGSTNDIAIIWPPGRKPILVTAYLTETTAPADKRNTTLAAVGKAVAEAVG
ncbi:MAG TPA: class A beta-lactamase [Pseudolabrys sp.]|nr:class A beta-lactamase [Pseudolabrys sp.]